jgi:ribosomal-protein-alanine N-acetyltransferase
VFSDVRLESERLVIRPLQSVDADQLHRVVSHQEVMRFLPEDVMTIDEVRSIITWLNNCYEQNSPENILKWTLAVVWKKTSTVIGWCGLGPLDFDPGETELFYGLSKSYWGMGIAAEAATAVLKYGFDVIGLQRIVAVTDPQNARSVRVLGKIGMSFEKTVSGLSKEHRAYEGFRLYSMAAE